MDRIDSVPVDDNITEDIQNCSLFNMEELVEAVPTRKAPGPSGIPAKIYKLVFDLGPDLLFGAINASIISVPLEGDESSAN